MKSGAKQWLWFASLWTLGVGLTGAVAIAIRFALGL